MSTAGKVLIVLVTLMLMVWVVLTSGVAERNRNWAELIDKNQKQIEKLEPQLTQAREQLEDTVQAVARQQEENSKAVLNLQIQVAALQDRVSNAVETQERVKYQLERVRNTLDRAKAAHELRDKELADTKQRKADLEKSVADLKKVNQDLKGRLAGLEDRFLATVSENKQLLQRLRSGSTRRSRGSQPRTPTTALAR